MTPEQVLDKIKKCLALSKSSNEHEAGQAMKHAQVLMKKHNINIASVEVNMTSVKVNKNPARWILYLASIVSNATGTRVINSHMQDFQFFGVENNAEIAVYMFEVLKRQCTHARKQYLKTISDYSTTTKNKYAESFCVGWVKSVSVLVDEFVNSEEDDNKIEAAIKAKYNNLRAVNSRRKAVNSEAYYSGVDSGKNAQLYHGMNGESQKLLR